MVLDVMNGNTITTWHTDALTLLLVIGLTACGGGTAGPQVPTVEDKIAELKTKGESIVSENDLIEYRNSLDNFIDASDSIVQKPMFRRRLTELQQLAERYEKPDWQPLQPKKTAYVDNKRMEFPFTIHRGDAVRWNVTVDGVADRIRVFEERTGRTVKQANNSALLDHEFTAEYTDVYTLVIESSRPVYANVSIDRKPRDAKSYFQSTDFVVDTLPSAPGDSRAVKYDELVMTNVFNEPYKVVVSQQLTLSGSPRITIPIELPKGTQEFIYQVRISGQARETQEDGQLYDKLITKHNEYKLLGFKVFESTSTGSSLTRELLNSISFPKREKFSCNIYFFDREGDAKNFVDVSPNGFKYDMKNSIKNSESRNGLIKYRGTGFVYLGLESTSSFSTTYAWVDVVAAKMETRYVRIAKKPLESTSY